MRPITHNCFLRKRNYLILSHVEQSTICFAFFHKDIVVNMFDSIEELNLRASADEFFVKKIATLLFAMFKSISHFTLVFALKYNCQDDINCGASSQADFILNYFL